MDSLFAEAKKASEAEDAEERFPGWDPEYLLSFGERQEVTTLEDG